VIVFFRIELYWKCAEGILISFQTQPTLLLLIPFNIFPNNQLGKAALGRLVHKKTATAVAITEVRTEVILNFIQSFTVINFY
jgi:hypothetical protein